jgi:hypothetical protein
MASPPIACSLSAADYRERLAEVAEVGRSSLIEVKELPNESVLHFRYPASTRDRLRAIVSQEAACCAFLDLSLRASDTELVLTLRAPAEARPIVADLIRRFRGVEGSTARPRR